MDEESRRRRQEELAEQLRQFEEVITAPLPGHSLLIITLIDAMRELRPFAPNKLHFDGNG
jgi:hypothetical protein